MSYDTQDSVALLNWDGTPAKTIQDVDWVFDQRDDSTNRLRVTTTLSEVDGVESEQELVFKNRRFIVSEIDRDRDADEAVLVADEAQVELGGIILTDFAFNSWTAFQALEFALEGTRWTPGDVQNVRFGRANFDDLTVLEACHFLANHQDAVLSFDSLRRRVNLTATRGTVREEVFTYGRQLTNIEKAERQPTLTTLYPTGADDMTVARVNDGSEVVEDYGYYTSRGISLANARRWYKKEEYWEDSRYEVAENMLRDAQKRLADEAYPQITYTLTAQATTSVDGTDDFDLTDIGLGDRVYVWDQEIDTKLSAEVTAVTTSSDQSQNQLTLSTLPESFGGSGSRGGGYYFGDSGSTAGNPLFPRSGFQPRPSTPILEELSQLGVGEVRWNGQDHNGNYDTIPVRFGSVIPRVARLGVDGSIPSPDSDDAFEGTVIHERGGGTATVAFGAAGSYAVWFYMLGQDQNTKSEYSQALIVDVSALVDVDQIQKDLDDARQELEEALVEWEQGQQGLDDRLKELNDEIIPQLEQDLQQAEAQLSQSMTTLDGKLDNLNDTVIPGIEQQLTTGLQGAHQDLEDLDVSLRDHFGTQLDNVLAALSAGGRTWSQGTPPPAGATYEWAGPPHESESIKKVDGDETYRNRVTNPEFTESLNEWAVIGGTVARTSGYAQMWGGRGGHKAQAQSTGTGLLSVVFMPNISVTPGQWVGVRGLVATEPGVGVRAQVQWFNSAGTALSYSIGDYHFDAAWYAGKDLGDVFQAPANAASVRVRFVISPGAAGDRLWVDRVIASVADTQQDAVDQVAEYFDGDSLDDRQNDLWINGNGQQHRWDNTTKSWKAFTNEQIQEAIDALEAQVDSVLTMAGSKNSVAYHTGPPTVDGVAPGDMWRQRSANGTVTGRWYWTGTRWQLEQITNEVIDNLDAGKITAGAATIDQGFIQKLMVDGLTARVAALARAIIAAPNLLPNASGWGDDRPEGFSQFAYRGDHKALVVGNSSGSTGSATTDIPFQLNEGETYTVTTEMRANVPGTHFYFQLASQDGGTSPYIISNQKQTLGLTYEEFSADFTVPQTGQYLFRVYPNHPNGAPNPGGNQWFRNLSIKSSLDGALVAENSITSRALNTLEIFSNTAVINEIWSRVVRTGLLEANEALIGGTLIRDNAVTARTVNVNSVFGDTAVLNKIFAEVVTTRLLNAGQAVIGGALIRDQQITVDHLVGLESILTELLRAKKIEAGDIAANAINGMTIAGGVVSGGRVEGAIVEGGTVRVGPRFTGGSGNAGIELASNGVIRRWDTAGNLDMVLDGNNNRITGRVSTARPGSPGVIIEPSTTAGNPGIFFASGGSASGNNSGVVHDNDWNMVIRGRRTSSGAARQRTKVEGGFHITSGRLTSDVEATFTDGIQVSSRDSHIYPRLIVHDWMHNPGAPSNSTSPANVRLGGTGNYGRYFSATSSRRRAKINIETVHDDMADRILDLDPKDWLDRHQLEVGLGDDYAEVVHHHDEPGVGPTANEEILAEKLGEVPRRVPGLIAEEVRDAGLDDYVTYGINQDTGEEELESVAYDRLWALLIPVVRKQRDTIAGQQHRIDDLESRLAALEARL